MNFLVIGSGAREHIIAEKLDIVGANVFSVLTNMNPGLIQISKKYLDTYTKEYPANISNALSFSTNPNCSCRNQLISHYNDNKEIVDQFHF